MRQLYLFKQAPKARYGGHEGLLPKKHWLKRAVTAAVRDPHFWCQPETLSWGLTPTMLKAAKHWAIAFKLLEPQGDGKYYNVSEFARKLLLDDGSDPYLEDPQSQWLLHWNLLREPCYLKTWQWFFNRFYLTEFDPEYALGQYVEYVCNAGDTVAESTLAADLKCLYRLYGGNAEALLEDQLMTLFSDLSLLRDSSGGAKGKHQTVAYRKRVGLKLELKAEVLLYACLEYAQQRYGKVQLIELKELLYQPNSPGVVFWLSQYQLEGVLDQLCNQFKWLHRNSSADLNQLSWDCSTAGGLESVWRCLFAQN
jgi:hypothetical protein